MTTSLDSEMSWISFEDSQSPRICPLCRQPLSIKQINLSEACRTCFNEDCTAFPDIEYIQRSYKDMDLESSETSDMTLGCLDEEMQGINQLLSQVENMLSHTLSPELKNELSSLNKQLEDFQVGSKKKPLGRDEPEITHGDFFTNTLESGSASFKQPQLSSSYSFSQNNGSTVSQSVENATVVAYQSSQQESCDMMINNSLSTCNTGSAYDPFYLNVKISPPSRSAYDNCDNMWQNNCESDYFNFKPIGDIETPELSGTVPKNHLDSGCTVDKDDKDEFSETFLKNLLDSSRTVDAEDVKDEWTETVFKSNLNSGCTLEEEFKEGEPSENFSKNHLDPSRTVDGEDVKDEWSETAFKSNLYSSCTLEEEFEKDEPSETVSKNRLDPSCTVDGEDIKDEWSETVFKSNLNSGCTLEEEFKKDEPSETFSKNHLDPSCTVDGQDIKDEWSETAFKSNLYSSCTLEEEFEKDEPSETVSKNHLDPSSSEVKRELDIEKEAIGSDQEFDFSLKKLPTRCYRPRRGLPRTVKQETQTIVTLHENVTGDTPSEMKSFPVDESSELKMFPTLSASPDACQSFPELYELVSLPISPQSENCILVNDDKLIPKPRTLDSVPQSSDQGQVAMIPHIEKRTPNSRDVVELGGKVVKKGRNASARKKIPSKQAAVPKPAQIAKTQESQMSSGGSNSGFGFCELKKFGGAKCSAPSKVAAKKTGKKVAVKKEALTIAYGDTFNIQQSNVNTSLVRNTTLSNIFN